MIQNKLLEQVETLVKKEETRLQGLLMHYTTEAGLYGVLKSQTLWATHFEFLNDKEEFWNFFIRHEKNIPFRGVFSKNEYSPEENNKISSALFYIKDFFKELFKQHGLFIASFCKVNTWQAERHGDLTMWRAYSNDGGYALVFNKDCLDEISKDEQREYEYFAGPLKVRRCQYGAGEQDNESFYQDLLNKTNVDRSPMAFLKALLNAGQMKHEAFKDEDEYRIISFIDLECKDGKAKRIKFRETDNAPYIELNEKGAARHCFLPILSIVIGPHKDQEERTRKLKIWLRANGFGDSIEVRKSEIPFVGLRK